MEEKDKLNLMVGDWVNIKEYPMKFEPKKFTEHHWVRSLCEFEPILLTEDMLRLNGFEIEKYHEEWEITLGEVNEDGEERTILSFNYDIENETYYITIGSFLVVDFIYVHQLQQILRLCDFDSLADKFVLEKQ